MVNDIISVNGISKSFGPISALCDVSLSVQQGLATAIVGDNGSGKSTLIKLLSGNLAPDTGTITVEGREHTHLTIAQALQMGIAPSIKTFPWTIGKIVMRISFLATNGCTALSWTAAVWSGKPPNC